jgi:UDP-N-acetylbacillosamine N-acetyltransferase
MAQTRLAVYGASGHGKVVAQIARTVGYDEIIFIDDGENKYLSFDDFLIKYNKSIPIALGIGENRVREIIFNRIKEYGCEVVTLVDKSALVAQDVIVGEGVVIMPMVVVNTQASIEDGVILNTACVVEHECVIKSFVHLSPHVSLGGAVCVGRVTHIGIGSCVIQNITIEGNVIVGAGSVVIKDIESDIIVAGNPSKKIRDIDA